MRQVVLDTETTGISPDEGHQIIEIGCIELTDRRKTDQYHRYLKPTREIEDGAYDVHGIDGDFLADKPTFADVARGFIDFIEGSELIIHNAPFDIGFINAELSRLDDNWKTVEGYCEVIDSLVLARRIHPGQKNSLDALCKRYEIDNSRRDLHGALLDAKLLTDVYLMMTGGQAALMLHDDLPAGAMRSRTTHKKLDRAQCDLRVVKPTAEEHEAHRRRLVTLDRASGGQCLWRVLDDAGAGGGAEAGS